MLWLCETPLWGRETSTRQSSCLYRATPHLSQDQSPSHSRFDSSRFFAAGGRRADTDAAAAATLAAARSLAAARAFSAAAASSTVSKNSRMSSRPGSCDGAAAWRASAFDSCHAHARTRQGGIDGLYWARVATREQTRRSVFRTSLSGPAWMVRALVKGNPNPMQRSSLRTQALIGQGDSGFGRRTESHRHRHRAICSAP